MRRRLYPGAASAGGLAVLALLVSGAGADGATDGTDMRNVWDGVYTAAQAERGGELALRDCAECHAANMRGSPGAPGMAGPEFLFNWHGRTAADLFEYVRETMPPGQTGRLGASQYADLLAAIFAGNGFPSAEDSELSADADELGRILITRQRP